MEDLLTSSDDNLGGLCLFRFAPRHFFSSLTPGNLVFKPNCDWIKIEAISETGKLDQETVPDDAGDYYNVSASVSLPKERAAVDLVLSKYSGIPAVINFKDQNGNIRTTGHYRGEINLSHNSSTGEKASDENSYRISFKGKQEFKADFA